MIHESPVPASRGVRSFYLSCIPRCLRQMRGLFLFGGGFVNFGQLSALFMEAIEGDPARIGLLFSDRKHVEPYFDRYANTWCKLGATVIPISPDEDGNLPPTELEKLRECTGVFMCGGDTRRYHELYVKSEAGEVIADLYRSGRPYGGLSAGALVVPSTCLVWGDRVRTSSGMILVGGAENSCDAPVQLDAGLGLIDNVIIETHFTSRSGFSRLVYSLEHSGVPHGIGIDDGVCVRISDERWLSVAGIGRCYLLRRDAHRGSIETRVLDPSKEPVDLRLLWDL